jgi:DNA-binding transcriptional regulator YhcF (GntR family)
MSASNRIVVSGTTLILSPELAKHFGKSAALVLQQVHYWLSKQNMSYGIVENGVQWIRNSYKQWQEQIPHISISTIRRAFSILEEKQIILSKTYERTAYFSGGDQVKYFTINYDALETSIGNLSDILIHKPGRIISRENRAGEAVQNQQKNIRTLAKMNIPPVQNEHPPIYITKTTSENTSLSGNLEQIEANQKHSIEIESAMPDKPAERDKLLIVEKMLSLWNTIVEQTQNKISLTPKRSQHLSAAFKQYFNNDLADWESFCCKIASSKFLMGEVKDFKAHLDWSIRFEIIQRILEDGYSFGDRVVNYTPRIKVSVQNTGIDSTDSCLQKEKQTHRITKQESKEALAIRHHVRQIVGDAIYNSWFENTDIILEKNEDNDDKATIYVSSRFIADRLRTHYADIVESYFNAIHVGEAPKTESVTHRELAATKSATPFVELSVTEKNVETMSECAPELFNQLNLDMNEQQEKPVNIYKEEFSQDERVQHKQRFVAFVNDESHNVACKRKDKTSVNTDAYLMHVKEKNLEYESKINCLEMTQANFPIRKYFIYHCLLKRRAMRNIEGRGHLPSIKNAMGDSVLINKSKTLCERLETSVDTERIEFRIIVIFYVCYKINTQESLL